MLKVQIFFSIFFLTSCHPDEYGYVKPTPNFTVYTVLKDGTPISAEVTYEQMQYCEDGEAFLAPDYVMTDDEGSAGVSISDGMNYKFYCKSGGKEAQACEKLLRKDKSIKLILEE